MDDGRLFESLRWIDSVGEPEPGFLEQLYRAAAEELGFEGAAAVQAERVTRPRPTRYRPAAALRRGRVPLAGVAAAMALILIGIAVLSSELGIGVAPSPSPSASGSVSPAPGPTASEWWRTDVSGAAAGPLAAGKHTSTYLQPALTYAVPDGWVNNYDRADGLQLIRDTPGNRSAVQAGGSPNQYLDVLRNARLAAKNCSNRPEPGAAFGAKDLVSALAKRSGLKATAPVRVAIGGLSGWQVDLAVATSWTTPCPESNGVPAVPTVQNGEAHWWLQAGARSRFIVLDDPQGGNILIQVIAAPADTFEAHLSASLPIIESFEFDVAP